MSDFRNDPNFPNDPNLVRSEMREYDKRVQWGAVAVLLLLIGGMIVAASWTGSDTQTAQNSPATETTGAGVPMGPAQSMPTPPRQLRH